MSFSTSWTVDDSDDEPSAPQELDVKVSEPAEVQSTSRAVAASPAPTLLTVSEDAEPDWHPSGKMFDTLCGSFLISFMLAAAFKTRRRASRRIIRSPIASSRNTRDSTRHYPPPRGDILEVSIEAPGVFEHTRGAYIAAEEYLLTESDSEPYPDLLSKPNREAKPKFGPPRKKTKLLQRNTDSDSDSEPYPDQVNNTRRTFKPDFGPLKKNKLLPKKPTPKKSRSGRRKPKDKNTAALIPGVMMLLDSFPAVPILPEESEGVPGPSRAIRDSRVRFL